MGLRGIEGMKCWYGFCVDFGRESFRSKPQLLKTCPSGLDLPIQDDKFPIRVAKVYFGIGLSKGLRRI